MRILEAFGEPIADGGQESFVFGIINAMDMTGLSVDCLSAYDCRSERYRTLVEAKAGRVYTLNLPFRPGKSRWNIADPFRRFLNRHHYDVVHIHSGSISVLTIMAAEADRAGVRRVMVHSHAAGFRDSRRHKMLRLLASVSMARHTDRFCACSRLAAKWKFEPELERKTLIIPNGIDVERFAFRPGLREQMREKLGIGEAYVIGHVGRFSKEKNHRFLIQLFEQMHARWDDCRLLLVGDGEDRRSCEQLVAEKGLTQKVIFTGSVNDVEHYLQAMDVFVLPSLYEGLGIAAVEAQASGLPVVVSEGVTEEVRMTGEVCRLSLDAGLKDWMDAVNQFRNRERRDNRTRIVDAGYDIRHSASLLRELYLE